MKILVAVDGSEYTRRMLAYLGAHEQWLGPQHQYTVVHVVPSVPPRAASFVGAAAVHQFHEEEAENVLGPIRSFFSDRNLQATFLYKVGPAGDEIAQLANGDRYDLLVIGSHGHGSVMNLVLGSVVTRVLARCSTPMLIVR